MYEITKISPDHIWAPQSEHDLSPVGAIIQPEPYCKEDEHNQLSWRVIKPSPSTMNYPAQGTQISMFGKGLTLRPLTQKEMEKLRAETKKD